VSAAVNDFARRILSKRERGRVKTVLLLTEEAIAGRLAAGEVPRSDAFFDGQESAAAEILEAVLLSAQREHEARKLPYVANLFAAIAFEPEIDRALANWAVDMAARLSWTQYVLLRLVHELPDHPLDLQLGAGDGWSQWGLSRQLSDLQIGLSLINGQSKTPLSGIVVPSMRLADQKLLHGGQLMFALLGLERIPEEDVEAARTVLAQEATKPDESFGVSEGSVGGH
jgi:hypothetical protein